MTELKKFDLIVVGAGISGLSAVLQLSRQKFPGTIGLLEARNRFGGRILTVKTQIEPGKIEIGANWIHGIINNPIYKILYKKKVIDCGQESCNKFYNVGAKTSNGIDIDPSLVKRAYEVYYSILKSTSKFHDTDQSAIYQDSMGKYLEIELNRWIEKELQSEKDIRIFRGLFDSLMKRETCISGCDSMEEASFQYFDDYKEFLGGNITIPSGYSSLVQVLWDDIQEMDADKEKVQYFLNSKVVEVQWPGLVSKEKKSSKDFPIRIECSNGHSFECKHLIITIPLGCLKKIAHRLFDPPLPQYKLECIKRMGYDVVDKIFMEYSSKNLIVDAFTKDGIRFDEIMLLWDDDNAHINDKPWYHKIYAIYYISDYYIQLWASGKAAQILESMDEDKVNDQLTKQFRKIFKQPKFPRANNVIITRWASDEFSLGSYSYIKKGSSPDDIENLFKPIYLKPEDQMPSIAFCGEATHREYFSTVHGAYLSGIECAKNFL